MLVSLLLVGAALAAEPADLGAVLAARREGAPAVPRVAWSAGAADEWLARGEPVVFAGAAAELGWRAVGGWTPEWLVSVSGAAVLDYYAHHSRREPGGEALFFSTYDDFELVAAMPELRGTWEKPVTVSRDTMAHFWDQGLHHDRYVFLKGVLANFPAQLAADVQPNPFAVGADGRLVPGNWRPPADNDVWMGTAGVRSGVHVDYQHNFYAQLVGSKQFVVGNDSAAGMFPFLHPRHRQVQSEAALRGMAVALLEPGDVLYIPPMWLHGATAASPASVSFSSCSPSAVDRAVEDAHMAPIPIDEGWEGWPAEDVRAFLRQYAEAVVGGPLAEVAEARYGPLGLGCGSGGGGGGGAVGGVGGPGIQAAADRVRAILEPVPEFARHNVAYDLVEAWAAYFVGPGEVAAFLCGSPAP